VRALFDLAEYGEVSPDPMHLRGGVSPEVRSSIKLL
jgi:hypothetical protein